MSMVIEFTGAFDFSQDVYAQTVTAVQPSGSGTTASPYKIKTYANLVWFQQYVDSGNLAANAVLEADITANGNLLKSGRELNGTPSYEWTPIAKGATSLFDSYSGTFDGQGHCISGLYATGSGSSKCGFFGTSYGTIKNLRIKDSYFGESGIYQVGSIVGQAFAGTVENCISDATIIGDKYIGGIVGSTGGSVKNCIYTGKITASDTSTSASVVSDYDNKGTVESCYYLNTCSLTSTRATSKTESEFASGEVCYLINAGVTDGSQKFYQTIGTDAYPLFSGGTVYARFNKLTNKYEYSNSVFSCEHSYNEKGFCVDCGEYEQPNLVNEYYEIDNYGKLVWIQEYINSGNNFVNIKLTGDIIANENLFTESGSLNGTPKYSYVPICKDTSVYYTGIFDGNKHTIKGIYDPGSSGEREENIALIGCLNGTVKNLNIEDSYFGSSNSGYVGSVAGRCETNAVIQNCSSSATIVAHASGGIVCENKGKVISCYYIGDMSNANSNYSSPIQSDSVSRGKGGELTSCYHLNTSGSTYYATSKSESEFKSGEVCYSLNNGETDGTQIWYQTIGKDDYPKYSGDTVYKEYEADSNTYSYTNTDWGCSGHKFTKGICVNCGKAMKPELKDNVYQIDNYGNLVWLQRYIDEGNTSVDAILISNIIANEDLLNDNGELKSTPNYIWTPISQSDDFSKAYAGIFDGNGHTISGLYSVSGDRIALFGSLNGTVKNLGIINSYFSNDNGYHISSIAGYGYDKSNIENSYSNSVVNGSMYCGGISGKTVGSIKNCYYAGKIKADKISNALVSESDFKGKIENSYYLNSCGLTGEIAKPKTEEEFASGEVAYILQKGQETEVWGQKIETDKFPMLGGEKVYEYKAYKGCSNKADYKLLYSNISTEDTFDLQNHSYVNGKCENCGKIEDGIGAVSPKIKSDGSIGIDFYALLAEDIANSDEAYVKLTFADGTNKIVPISQAEKNTSSEEGVTYYVFSCEIAPYEMNKEIKIQIFDGKEKTGAEFVSSVRECAENIINGENSNDEIAYAKALLNYGATAQTYFNQSTDDLANKNLEEADKNVDIINASTLESYKKEKASNENIGAFTGFDIVLGSKTTLNMYFEPIDGIDEEKLLFYIDDKKVEARKLGEKYVLTADEIYGTILEKDYKFKVCNDYEMVEIQSGVYSYCYNVLNAESGKYSEDLLKLISAFYAFQQVD